MKTSVKITPLEIDSEIKAIFEEHDISEPSRSNYLAEDLTQSHVADLLLRLFGDHKADSSRCLVVGAGRGGLSSNLGVRGIEVDSLEPFPPYSEIISWKYKRRKLAGRVLESMIEAANLNHDYYSCAAMIDVIEHVESPESSLQTIFKSLKSGGELYITVPTRFQFIDPHYKIPFICWMPLSIADKLLSIVGRLKEDGAAGRQKLSTMHYYTYNDFCNLARQIGFEVKDVRQYQIEQPEIYTFAGDRFAKISRRAKSMKLSWLLRFLSRYFIGHRFLLIKRWQ